MSSALLIVGTTWGVLALCFIALAWLTTFTLRKLDKRRKRRELEEANSTASVDNIDADDEAEDLDPEGDDKADESVASQGEERLPTAATGDRAVDTGNGDSGHSPVGRKS